MSCLIINADDLAIHPGIDAGIRQAFEEGVLTSTTMFMTTPFVERAVRDVVRSSRLPVGIHLSLTLGKAIAPPGQVPDLIDADGNLALSAGRILLLGRPSERNRHVYDQIRTEFTAQLSAARDWGISPSHVDSHQHVHMNPVVFAIVEDVAQRFGVSRVRLCEEPFFAFELREGLAQNLARKNPLKLALVKWLVRRIRPRLRTNDAFFGLMYSGGVTPGAMLKLLERIGARKRIWEIGLHPGQPAAPGDRTYPRPSYNDFIASPWRAAELSLLTDPGLREAIFRKGIRLTSYADLV
jgi:predicted glycoside hydrolase/deacetylase ChbG (UPF0249 family)